MSLRSDPCAERRSTTELWRMSQEIVERALDLEASDREAWIEARCEGDEELLSEARALLELGADEMEKADEPFLRVADRYESGDRLGPWQILRELGQGGTSTVYLARRAEGDGKRVGEQGRVGERERVAIKVLRHGLDPHEYGHRFEAEYRLLEEREHPGITRFFGLGRTDDHRPYLVMEYVDGLPLDQHCDGANLSIEERLRLFVEVCEVVDFAHRNLVIHRDLKPTNVLVSGNGSVKVLDFGVAKILDTGTQATTRTTSGSRMLTPAYASPEQLALRPLGTATDIYSLGVMLFEILGGQRPFRDQRPLRAVLDRLRDDDIPSLSKRITIEDDATLAPIAFRRSTTVVQLRRRLRGDLDAIVGTSLRLDPDERYPSVRELKDDLERHLEGRPVHARRATWRYLAGKLIRRRARELVIAALLILGGLGLLVGRELERHRVVLEKEKHETLQKFWLDLFLEASPARSQGRDTTVVEVLDRSRESVELLGSRPEVQASFLATIGRVYNSLGDSDQGRQHLSRAVDMLELHAPESVELAVASKNLGMVLYERGEFAAAREKHFRALEILEQKGDPENRLELASTLDQLGLVETANRRYEVAREYLIKSRDFYLDIHGGLHPDLANPIHNLGFLAARQARLDEAFRWYERALEIRRSTLKAPHPDLARSLAYLGHLRTDAGEAEVGLELLGESLAQWRGLVDGDHHEIVDTEAGRVGALTELGRFSEALELGLELLATQKRLFPGGHPTTARLLESLGNAQGGLGNLSEGRDLHRKALDLRRRLYPGEAHLDIASSLWNLGIFANAMGEFQRALPNLDEALEIYASLRGIESPEVLDFCERHVSAQRSYARSRVGDCSGSRRDFERSLELLDAPPGGEELEKLRESLLAECP